MDTLCTGEPNEARDPGVVYDTVVAWQPLPEPYKEKTKMKNLIYIIIVVVRGIRWPQKPSGRQTDNQSMSVKQWS